MTNNKSYVKQSAIPEEDIDLLFERAHNFSENEQEKYVAVAIRETLREKWSVKIIECPDISTPDMFDLWLAYVKINSGFYPKGYNVRLPKSVVKGWLTIQKVLRNSKL